MKTCKSCSSKNECAQYIVEGATEYCDKYVALQIKPMSAFSIVYTIGLSAAIICPLFFSIYVRTNSLNMSLSICSIILLILVGLFSVSNRVNAIIEYINDKEQ